MSLPSLAALTLQIEAPKRRGDKLEPSQRKRPKNDDNTLYFVSKNSDPERKLSNLFGGVEWGFQRAKFENGSVVAKFLDKGLKKEINDKYTNQEFKDQFAALYPDGKAETYIKPDGTALGMLAKLIGGICKQPKCGKNQTGFTRLKTLLKNENHVFFDPGEDGDCSNQDIRMTYRDFQNWQKANVKSELSQNEKEALLLELNRKKYKEKKKKEDGDPKEENKDPRYRKLLLSTGDKVLHEEPARAVNIDAYNYATDKGYMCLKGYEDHRLSIIEKVKNDKFRPEDLTEDDKKFWWRRYREELKDAVLQIQDGCQEARYVNNDDPPWRGGDMTGRVLMRVRDEIRSDEASCSADALR